MKSFNSKLTEDDLTLSLGLLPVEKEPVLAPREQFQNIKTKREAYKRCIEFSGMGQSEVAAYLEIDDTQFSRILNNKAKHLDNDKETLLMQVCGNLIPSQWQAYQFGCELKPIQSELEKQLAAKEQENEMLRNELDVLKKYGFLGGEK